MISWVRYYIIIKCIMIFCKYLALEVFFNLKVNASRIKVYIVKIISYNFVRIEYIL